MTARLTLRRTAPLAAAALALGLLAGCSGDSNAGNDSDGGPDSKQAGTQPGFVQTNLVANWEAYNPQIVEPELENAWGISLRPAGAGGHFWITAQASGKSFEYVGDVGGKDLFQDELKEVTIPEVAADTGPTGTVFNEKGDGFVITQKLEDGEEVTAPAKFLFATDSGAVAAWTERENEDGTKSFPATSELVFDQSKQGSSFLGVAITPANDKILLADFGEKPGLVVVDDKFQAVKNPGFASPFAKQYQPFNVQAIGESIFVTYAVWAEPGEEEPAPGEGRLAEFSADGKLIAKWQGGKYLNAPWGVAKAPGSGFGEHEGTLLVSNFGDGTIAALDPKTRKATDFLRRPDGHRVEIDGLWDIKFGNGRSLGRNDALYFAAGPGPEADGIFGRLTWQE